MLSSLNGERAPSVRPGRKRPTAGATAPTAIPLRHQASQVRSAASQVRRDTSEASEREFATRP